MALRAGLRSADAAPTGPQPVLGVGEAGYVASRRYFRYAQAVITVPLRACVPGPADPMLFVGLASAGRYARAGILCGVRAAAPGAVRGAGGARHAALRGGRGHGRWAAFIEFSPGVPAGPVLRTFPLAGIRRGQGIFASVYFNRASQSVRCVIALPGGTIVQRTIPMPGPAYTSAQALVEWSHPAALAPVSHALLAQFLSGGFTTAHGKVGNFKGPWALQAWEARGGGPAGQRVPVAEPGYLWADGTQRALGPTGNAFGVWLYP